MENPGEVLILGGGTMQQLKIKMLKRIRVVFFIMCVALFALVVRTGYFQIVRGEELQKEAIAQQTRDRIVSSMRGTIYDRNMKPLAISASAEVVSVTPNEIRQCLDPDKGITYESIAQNLCDILGTDYETVLKKLQQNSFYVLIQRKVDKDKADLVRKYITENKISGISLSEDSKRYYPYGNFASHVIGFTGTDNQGLWGIESVFDNELKGVPGRVIAAKNAQGIDMPFKYEKLVDAQNGLNVVLTIDEGIQHFVERHLETAVIENTLDKGAACIVMDVKTGGILAMATKPDYDLNQPFVLNDPAVELYIESLEGEEKSAKRNESLQQMWRNKAVVDAYEPGSTFKIFTSAMALEEKVIKLDDKFYCSGSKKVGPHDISCWKAGGHGQQTFVEGVGNSCNPVFMEVGAKVGTVKFREYFRGFGFTERTGIELSGEAAGIFFDTKNFNEVELATSSFGQGFTITPLQMVAGVASVANEGMLMEPHIVKALTDSNGNIVKNYDPKPVRQIVSAETAKTLCGVLEKVVSEGTGKNAYVAGYRVAGKTGTSEKLPRDSNKYIASFAGFAPADDPQIAVLVLLDEPMGEQYFGGVIAGPVMGRIMEDCLTYLKVEPLYTQAELELLEVPVPDVCTDMSVQSAKNAMENSKLKARIVGAGDTVINQIPKPGTRVNAGSIITLYTEEIQDIQLVEMPNLEKMTVAGATQALANLNLNIKVVGAAASGTEGNVVATRQDIAPGTMTPVGSVVRVEFVSLDIRE